MEINNGMEAAPRYVQYQRLVADGEVPENAFAKVYAGACPELRQEVRFYNRLDASRQCPECGHIFTVTVANWKPGFGCPNCGAWRTDLL